MRALTLTLASMFVATAGAHPPAAKRATLPAHTQMATVGTLAQIMRGTFFPNANLIFDVQTKDPAAPSGKENEAGGGASATFANIYTGWQVVENAAIVLAESSDLLMYPGRLCQNGKPVPVGRADWAKYVKGMKDAGVVALQAARTKNLEKVNDATNAIADACSNCHEPFRDKGDADSPARCTPPTKTEVDRLNRALP